MIKWFTQTDYLMPKIIPLSRKTLIKKLRKLGFTGPFSATRHEYLIKINHKIFVPNTHGSKDVGVPIIAEIIKQLVIDRDDFLNL